MCFGIFGRVCHWGPLTAIGIIKCITGMTVHCCGMWWPPHTIGGFLNTVCFMSLSGLTLYNLLSAMYHGPGHLPLKWKPESEEDCQYLQWCGVCHGYKAPRSHHCRKCGRCILKMDHHCPWINNCVGWGNHGHFTAFLSFATLGCVQSSIILSCSLYHALYRLHYLYKGTGTEPIVHLRIYGMIMCVLALGFSIGVVIAVGMLLFFQVKSILRNRTAIEDWILEKANYRRKATQDKFIFPYDLGRTRNVCQVLNISCQPIGDGINWPVVDNCNQYTLTLEQIEQKNEKRSRTKVYSIIHPASGSWVPIRQGLMVCLRSPCTDEARIKLDIGDKVLVTRWRKLWLFGEKIQEGLPESEVSANRIRGWFPRRCAVELVENGPNLNQQNDKKIK